MAPERSLYSDEVMDHFLHPRNSGKLADATLEVEQLNVVCGDRIVFYFRLEGDLITEVGFQSFGCAVAVAAASLLSEAIKGKRPDEADEAAARALARVRKDTADDKTHCSNMVEQAWRKAVAAIKAHRKA